MDTDQGYSVDGTRPPARGTTRAPGNARGRMVPHPRHHPTPAGSSRGDVGGLVEPSLSRAVG
jgi:hypothetical protein